MVTATKVPELHRQWQSLDLAEVLGSDPAFINVDSLNSILSERGGFAHEGIWRRAREPGGSLGNSIRLAAACREVDMPFVWARYDRFVGERTPCTPMDEAQYRFWNEHFRGNSADKTWEAELVDEIKAIVQPADISFVYPGSNIFASTPLARYLAMWGTRTIILSGYHTDWCVEMAARSARELGCMPVVVGDACGSTEERHRASLEQINECFAPVVTTEAAIELIKKGARTADSKRSRTNRSSARNEAQAVA